MKDTKVISAVDENFGIGKDGGIPWKVPADFQFFKAMTYDSSVVVGRKTFENIGGLPGRRFYVLTSDEEKSSTKHDTDENGVVQSVTYVNSFGSLYHRFMNRSEDVWIAGGQSVYDHYVGRSEDIYLSKIPGTYDCDRFFPKDSLEKHYDPVAEVSADGFDFVRYKKTTPVYTPIN